MMPVLLSCLIRQTDRDVVDRQTDMLDPSGAEQAAAACCLHVAAARQLGALGPGSWKCAACWDANKDAAGVQLGWLRLQRDRVDTLSGRRRPLSGGENEGASDC